MKEWAANNNEKSSIIRIARSILSGGNAHKITDGYKTYFKRLQEFNGQQSKNHLELTEVRRNENASNEAKRQATALFNELSTSGRQSYIKRIREEFPKLDDETLNSPSLIIDTIMEDIVNGTLNRTHFKMIQPQAANIGAEIERLSLKPKS